ncbi:MAG: hypothetical protein H7X71_00510 [Chitinophagales bacterium]|nr:hypothetical protein [Chitinophagales bacterium]
MDQQLPKHDCNNFLEKVFLVLDGELPTEERELFITDIERCKGCLEHYKIEKNFKDFIVARYERRSCSDTLKANILSEIDKIEAEQN